MRIVFVMPHQRHARRYELVLAELLSRGHRVRLGLKGEHHREADELIARLASGPGELTRARVPVRDDRWAPTAEALRRGIDYLRYLGSAFFGASKLRRRAAGLAPRWVVRAAGMPLLRSPAGIRLLDAVLRRLEAAIPESAEIRGLLRSEQPDLLLVSPLVDRPWQADYIRAARSEGIRSALCVASWDNLTNKGLIRDIPDRVYLWNDDQRREAVELHGVPEERVVVTGAHSFDHWFDWRASTSSGEFRRQVGLPADGDLLLYVGSSQFIGPGEPRFVERWLRGLRSHPDARLREAAVLIRPHPTTGDDWADSALADLPGVAVWPRRGAVHIDAPAKSAFFDSIYHSVAVVGINTSALIETAIVGRPTFTVLDPQFRETQEGTLHFHYLLRSHGGPLTVAADFDQHFEQLSAAIAQRTAAEDVERAFVQRFVRPSGLERPAARVMADALEAQAGEPAPRPARATALEAFGAVALRPLAALATPRSVPRRGGARQRSRRPSAGRAASS
jgi:hypothetical protein